jgi:hypothetical protein
LPIKVIAPTRALKTFQAHPNQIIEQLARFDLVFFRGKAAEIGERRQRK